MYGRGASVGGVVFVGLAACGRVGFGDGGDGGDGGNALEIGLVGHWKLDEGDGAQTPDASGSGNQGVLVGAPGFVPGRIGMALSLDGIDDHVDIVEQTNVLDMAMRSFTYSMWVNVTANVGLYDTPWWRGGSSTFYPGYDLELGEDPWHASLSDGNALALATLGAAETGRWVLLTVVVDRERGRLTAYRDGVVVDDGPFALGSLSTTRTASIGGFASSGAIFDGLVDDVRLYDRALAADEVEALFRVP